MSEEASPSRPPIQVVHSDHLPPTVEAVYLPRLARLLVNGRLWREAPRDERAALVARLAGDAGTSGSSGVHVWGWSADGRAADLAALRALPRSAWDELLPVE